MMSGIRRAMISMTCIRMAGMFLFLSLLVAGASSSCIDITDTFGQNLPASRRWAKLDVEDDSRTVMYQDKVYAMNYFLSMLCNAALYKYNEDHPATEPLVTWQIENPNRHLLLAYEKPDLGNDYCIRFQAHRACPLGQPCVQQLYTCDTEIDSLRGNRLVSILNTSCREA